MQPPAKKLHDQMCAAIRIKQYSSRTEETDIIL